VGVLPYALRCVRSTCPLSQRERVGVKEKVRDPYAIKAAKPTLRLSKGPSHNHAP